MRIAIYGASDDLIEVEVGDEEEEFGVYSSIGFKGHIFVGGVLAIGVYYVVTWHFKLGQVSDADPIPDWPIRIRQQPDVSYSLRVEIDVPEDTRVEFRHAKKGANDEGDVYTFGAGWAQ